MDISSKFKKAVAGVSLTLALLASGTALGTTAQAQERDRNHQWQQDRNDQRGQNRDTSQRDQNHDRNWNRQRNDQASSQERNRESYRQQQNERSRQENWRQEQRGRDRYAYKYPAPRGYSYGGGYSNYGGYNNYGSYGNERSYGGGFASSDFQRGYSDGLNKGQEDARDRDSFNPNNSSHYRSGDSAYREGFVRGYSEGYRQYAGNRGW